MSRLPLTARSLPLALALAAAVGGCANPADDKFKVTATDPKPVDSAPAPAPDAAPAAKDAPAPAPTPAPEGSLTFSGTGSKVEFIGSKVTGSHSGGFKTFQGQATLSPDGKELKGLSTEIDMNSLWSDNDNLTGHLKNQDFFDVPKFPKASFVSTEIKPGGEKGATHTVTGNLTLHGTTKSISFPATVAVKDGAATVASEFALNRKDFGIVYPGKTDDLIRDEVVIKLDVKAAKG